MFKYKMFVEANYGVWVDGNVACINIIDCIYRCTYVYICTQCMCTCLHNHSMHVSEKQLHQGSRGSVTRFCIFMTINFSTQAHSIFFIYICIQHSMYTNIWTSKFQAVCSTGHNLIQSRDIYTQGACTNITVLHVSLEIPFDLQPVD